jgi:hypothetical protein
MPYEEARALAELAHVTDAPSEAATHREASSRLFKSLGCQRPIEVSFPH